MYDARRVKTLYTRRRRLIAAAADMARRADVIRRNLLEVEADLQSMVLFVPPVVRRAPTAVSSRAILDLLQTAETPPTTREVMAWLMERKGLPLPSDPQQLRRVQNRVWIALNRLAKRGIVKSEAESRRVVRWRLCLQANQDWE